MTSKNELYYIIQTINESGVLKINSVLCDWEVSDISYYTGLSFLSGDIGINDIFVTDNTSYNLIANTLFVATTSGVYILDEETTEYDLYYTK